MFFNIPTNILKVTNIQLSSNSTNQQPIKWLEYRQSQSIYDLAALKLSIMYCVYL